MAVSYFILLEFLGRVPVEHPSVESTNDVLTFILVLIRILFMCMCRSIPSYHDLVLMIVTTLIQNLN